jgi:hypothetical protein
VSSIPCRQLICVGRGYGGLPTATPCVQPTPLLRPSLASANHLAAGFPSGRRSVRLAHSNRLRPSSPNSQPTCRARPHLLTRKHRDRDQRSRTGANFHLPLLLSPQRGHVVRILLSTWSPLTESNRRPSPYHGDALPTELRGRGCWTCRYAAARHDLAQTALVSIHDLRSRRHPATAQRRVLVELTSSAQVLAVLFYP